MAEMADTEKTIWALVHRVTELTAELAELCAQVDALPADLPTIDPAAIWMTNGQVVERQFGFTYSTRQEAAETAASALAALAVFDRNTP